MNLNLTRPLCFFDLETTGVNVTKDRIVEIAILKLHPDGNKEDKTWRVNPECPIPPQVSAVHGIYDADVADEPNFKSLSKKIHNFIKDADLAGYNSDRFDIPLLAEEMLRAEIDFDFKNFKTVDVQTIFHKMEQRTLTAALKFYCNEELVDAHSAMADTQATHDVLMAQLERYKDLEGNVNFLSEFTTRKKSADFAGFIVFNKEGQECFSFGKHKGKTVESILEDEPGYFGWLINADFPMYTKKVLTAIRLRKLNTE
ncbi:MAG: DNA polymerase III subunit epsilon [Flavobacteriales bacterium MED-G15]|nr:MAG: DNA polymerase III subunit epsilon [Flavobacteriales bacterium MED-G15]|tara:strand:- start:18256 stop:19026 length:771 start_codon:yes stop_codon:yes gene_type:complete